MKSLLAIVSLSLTISTSSAQTATNFTCNDCSGVSHDLFTELDAGNVIVLCWVMPCGACSGPATTAYNTVQSFQAANPNKVKLFLADDYGNSTCTYLNSWANGLGIAQNSWSYRFSNSAINMTDYGSTGMPKIVVLGGVNHSVFYNVNNTVSQTALQNAINTALASTGISEQEDAIALTVSPNPVSENAKITFTLTRSAEITITLYDLQGKAVKELSKGLRNAGKNEITFSTEAFASGMYLLKFSDGKNERVQNVTISH